MSDFENFKNFRIQKFQKIPILKTPKIVNL